MPFDFFNSPSPALFSRCVIPHRQGLREVLRADGSTTLEELELSAVLASSFRADVEFLCGDVASRRWLTHEEAALHIDLIREICVNINIPGYQALHFIDLTVSDCASRWQQVLHMIRPEKSPLKRRGLPVQALAAPADFGTDA
jgi:hypothetical protein